jgi:hypothetical protein
MTKRIYSYYESIQTVDQPEEFACANIWKQSWEKQGWECVMLNKSHAKGSNLHLKLVRALVDASHRMPPELVNDSQKIMARYLRWCALHASGGGWMSDYDVVNINFPSHVAETHEKNGNLQVITGGPAWLFYATPELCHAAITKFINSELFNGTSLVTESEILVADDKLGPIQELLFHARKTPTKKRSQEMNEHMQ